MRKSLLTTLALFVSLCAPCAAAAGEVGEVPFTFEKGYVIVAGTVKGKEPVEFIVSTGATNSTVHTGMLEKYQLRAFYTGVGVITGGPGDQTVSFATVPDVRVGPASATGINARLGWAGEVTKLLGREIFATLGQDFFRGRTVQFDFAKRVMRFLDKDAAEALRAKAAGAAGAAVFRMEDGKDVFERPIPLPLVEKVMFDGRPARVLLATGVPAVLALAPATAKKLGFEVPPEKSAPLRGSVGELQLGPLKFSGVPVVVYPKGVAADALGAGGALAGTAFLQNFVVTFDFRGKVVVLERL